MNDTTLSVKQSLPFHEEITESLLQLRMAIERLDASVAGLNGGVVNATVDVDTSTELSLHQTLKITPTTIAEAVEDYWAMRITAWRQRGGM